MRILEICQRLSISLWYFVISKIGIIMLNQFFITKNIIDCTNHFFFLSLHFKKISHIKHAITAYVLLPS